MATLSLYTATSFLERLAVSLRLVGDRHILDSRRAPPTGVLANTT
jgi:hypothetical protein